jgi:pyruvate-formate lyase-activating enzyme
MMLTIYRYLFSHQGLPAPNMSALLLNKGLRYNVIRQLLTLKARFRTQSFFCRALAGESNYNICINSDMTVSCNCQDFDGSGHIGDLNVTTFERIIHGATANSFRAALAARTFPLAECPVCAELSLVPTSDIPALLSNCHMPRRGIMVENTAACNLQCSLCRRRELLAIRNKPALDLHDVAKVAALINEQGIESVYYFNLGEPFLPEDIYQQVSIIRGKNPHIRIITSTNGMLLDSEEKIKAALLMDYVVISLDGVSQEMVGRYQAGSDFARVYANMKQLAARARQAGRLRDGIRVPIIEWRYILFRWNDAPGHIDTAIHLARDADADLIVFAPGAARFIDRSWRYRFHPYFAALGKKGASGEIVVNLSGVPEHLISP